MQKRVRTFNCTHVDMDRVYGRDQQCYVCGREPSIGFLYECRQDGSIQSLHHVPGQSSGTNAPKLSTLRLQLEEIGLSQSVIRTAEQGLYTATQLEVLKSQKHDLKQTIEDSIQRSQIQDAVARLAVFATAPGNVDAVDNKAKDTSASCAFRACHTCRPYYRDRIYISFAAVVSAEFQPVSEYDVQHLPTKSASIMRSIGETYSYSEIRLGHDDVFFPPRNAITFASLIDAPQTASTTTSESSELTFKTTQSDIDELHALRRPRRRFYDIGHRSSGEIARDLSRMPSLLSRQGLKYAIQGILHQGRDSSSSGSMITLPVPRSGTVRNPSAARPVGDFDIGALRRVRRQKEKNEVRNGTYVGGFENVGITPAAIKGRAARQLYSRNADGSCSSESELSTFSCVTEDSDVESEGDMPFTGRGVQSHGVDTIDANMPASKPAIRIRTKSISCNTDDTKQGVESEDIVAQV